MHTYFSRLYHALIGTPSMSQSSANLQTALQRLSSALSAAESAADSYINANPSDGSTDATLDAYTNQVAEANNRVNALTTKLGGTAPEAS